jgi:hypothetical protein
MRLCIFIILIGLFSSCKLFREVKKSETSNTTTTKTDEGNTKVDTSKTSKEKEYERITYVYPPSDTTIINNYYKSGNMPPPQVIIQERGQEKEQTQNFDYEAWYKHKADSAAALSITKDVKSETKIGPSLIEWILISGLGLLLLKNFGILPSISIKK